MGRVIGEKAPFFLITSQVVVDPIDVSRRLTRGPWGNGAWSPDGQTLGTRLSEVVMDPYIAGSYFVSPQTICTSRASCF